ncbi:MAG: hypothetical protein ACI9VR_000372 [Cognaticolwellia sp.]|jgi:hypothetical protein
MQYNYGSKVKGDPEIRDWHHRALWGLVELSDPVDISDVCPNGDFARIRTKTSIGNSITTMILGTLYSPSTVQVWCADGDTFRAQVSPAGEVLKLEAPVDQAAVGTDLSSAESPIKAPVENLDADPAETPAD